MEDAPRKRIAAFPATHRPAYDGQMQELRSFFERYAELYMRSDADAIAALCETPFLAVREGRAIHLSDTDAVRAHLTDLMAAYKAAGASRAAITDLRVEELGVSGRNVTVRWHVTDEDGKLIRDFRTTYHLLTEETAWRILAYTNHD